jgi:endonuclease YncB( thermonuclease family)
MGMLTINGTVDLSQFWPTGGSDADTTKIILSVGANSFIYTSAAGTKRKTKVYLKAQYDDRGTLKPLLRNGNTVIVRLQGIDAPELHFRPTAIKGKKLAGTGLIKDYRQHQGETATVRLAKFLKSFGASTLKCQFVTQLDDSKGPAEAVDKYGRFVGNIVLSDGTDVNLWILRNGLAVVALYNSMLDTEIHDCIKAGDGGKTAKSSITKYFTQGITPFEPKIEYQRPTKAKAPSVKPEGESTFIFPKLFRRQTNWWANKRAGNISGNFAKFIADNSSSDYLFDTKDFLQSGHFSATPRLFSEFLVNNALSVAPKDMVFKEAPSTLYRQGKIKKGRELKDWDF